MWGWGGLNLEKSAFTILPCFHLLWCLGKVIPVSEPCWFGIVFVSKRHSSERCRWYYQLQMLNACRVRTSLTNWTLTCSSGPKRFSNIYLKSYQILCWCFAFRKRAFTMLHFFDFPLQVRPSWYQSQLCLIFCHNTNIHFENIFFLQFLLFYFFGQKSKWGPLQENEHSRYFKNPEGRHWFGSWPNS